MKTLFILSLTLAACRLSAQNPAPTPMAQLPAITPTPDPLLRHLPPDASSIYHFNLSVLTTKLPLQQLTERIPLPQQNTANRELAAILREPGRAGVDTIQGVYLCESKRGFSLLVHMADTIRWWVFLKALNPALIIKTDPSGNHSIATENMGAAWNKDFAIVTFSPTHAMHHSKDLLKGFDDSTALRDPLFVGGFSDNADIHAWTEPGKIAGLAVQLILHRTPKYPALKVHSLTSLRFEKGRVLIKSAMSLPPGAETTYRALIAHTSSNDLMSRLPSGTVLGMLNLHINPAAVPDLLDALQARGRVEGLLFDKGVSLELFSSAFRGDLLLTAIQPPVDSGKPATRPNIFLAATLRDTSCFWSWSNHLKWLKTLNKRLPAHEVRDSMIVLGSSAKRLDAWFSDNSNADIITINNYSTPLNGWIDFKALALALHNRSLNTILGTFDRLNFSAGRLTTTNQLETTTELRLINKEENSLKTLFGLFQ